jgi:dipeptidyl aminopeptidase/acylaminoacyl peptidase
MTKKFKLWSAFAFLATAGIAFGVWIRSDHGTPLAAEVLLVEGVLRSKAYEPEAFLDLPTAAVFGLEAENYSKCVSRLAKLPYQIFEIRYLSQDVEVVGYVMYPRRLVQAQSYPAVIMNRGGNRDYGRLTACGFSFLSQIFGHGGDYVLIFPQYRGVAGGEGKDEFGGADIHDVLSLFEIAKKLPFVDESNLFVAGWSRGGMMTYLALKHAVPVRAAVVVAGVSDLEASESERPEMARIMRDLIPNDAAKPNAYVEELQKRSALHWPEVLSVPLLLVHGGADKSVSVQHSTRLAEAIKLQGLEHKLVIYPEGEHSLRGFEDELENEVSDWWEAHHLQH